MLFRCAADLVVVGHLGFILFVGLGGFLVLRWRVLAWFHIPAAIWGALIEFGGWVCPLTPLENMLRRASGAAGYGGGFVDYYLLPIIYPVVLNRGVQVALGVAVIVLNGIIYAIVFWRRLSRNR